MKTGIYQIRNLMNGKRYIGSCARERGFKHRWSVHRRRLRANSHHSRHLQNAWNVYGEDAFVFEVLLYCDPENCLMYEQIMLDGYNPAYNICQIANNRSGLRHTTSTKRKIATSLRGRKCSEEHKENIAKARLGSRHSEETRQRMSESQKKRWGDSRES